MFGGSNHCSISDLSPLRPSWENSFQRGTILSCYHIPSEKITRPSLSSIHGLHPDNFIFFLSDTRLSSDALLPNPFAVTGLLVGGSEDAVSSTHLLFSVPSEDKMRHNKKHCQWHNRLKALSNLTHSTRNTLAIWLILISKNFYW